MYAARLIGPQEERLFDAFIASHPKGHFLQSYGWGEVKRATGWQPLRLLLEKGGAPVAAASLLKRPIPRTPYCILYCPWGPVVDFHQGEVFSHLMAAIDRVARRQRAVF